SNAHIASLALHSFPTRRSSDLNKALTAVEGGVTELKNTLGRVGRMQLDLGINADYYAGVKQTGPAGDLFGSSRSAVSLHLNPNPDRKSTRLNSSHQIISYAVFC